MNKILKLIYPYILAGFLSSLILFYVLELWKADLSIPFVYSEDGLFVLFSIKGGIDNGWYLDNPFLGMPTGLDLRDFPISDNFHLLFIKLISLFCSNPATILNTYYLLTFPFTTVISLFVFRYFRFSYATSILGSLFFTFLPYHLQRGEHHLFLSAYYLVPLIVMVILLLFTNTSWVFKHNEDQEKLRLDLRYPKSLFAVGICILIGSSGFYYAFFSCFFLLIAGISASVNKKRFYPLLISGILVAIISFTMLFNIAPSILNIYKNEKKLEVGQRVTAEAEIYGMKIIQLILPVNGHRVTLLRKLKKEYNETPYRPLVNENSSSSLGLMGSFGFFVLIGWLFYNKSDAPHSKLKTNLSILNASAVFLGTIGGLGSLFALLISPQIRAYNRISVFIAFFSLFAFVLLLEEYYRKHVNTIKKGVFFYLFLIFLLIIGILDQTNKYFVPAYASIKTEYLNDADFVHKIEASALKNGMIFQLPYVAFPESWPVNKMTDYAHLKGYIHSKTLRWSYGVMHGTESDRWQSLVSKLPIDELIETIVMAGFNSIYLDRYGFEDRGNKLEAELTHLLNMKPIISKNERLVFFKIQDPLYTEKIIQKRREEETQRRSKDNILYRLAKIETNYHAGSIDIFESFPNVSKMKLFGVIHVSGWAFDPHTKKPVKSIMIVNNGKPLSEVPVNINRQDVASTFKNKDLLMTGWDTVFSVKKIGTGKHRLEFYANLSDNTYIPLRDYSGNTYFDIEII